MARQKRKGKEEDKYLGKEMVFRQTREVVCRNPIQAFIEDIKGKRVHEESRRAGGGHERLLTESSPIDGHLGMSTVQGLSTEVHR